MGAVPRPLIGVLVVLAVFFALWTVALKKTLTGSGSGGSSNPGSYQSAINQARAVQGIVNHAAARAGGTPVQSLGAPGDTTPSPSAAPAAHGTLTTPAPTHPSATAPITPLARHHPPSGQNPAGGTSTIGSAAAASGAVASVPPAPKAHPGLTGIALVRQALDQHRVLALLFYNPSSADDQAVNSEMAHIPTQGGKVVKLAVPLQNLGTYASLLNQVPVNFSPTLVVINRDRQAEEIAGFADSVEIDQRVAEALDPAPSTQ
jgi:hypothetical protein